MTYIQRVKEEFLNNIVTKEEEIEGGEKLISFLDLYSNLEYHLDGKADEYFLRGVEAVFNYLEKRSERSMLKENTEW